MSKSLKPKTLIWDMETGLLTFQGFSCGKQVVRHNQLVPGKSRYSILCITYCINEGPVNCIRWTPDGGQDKIIEEFDSIIKTADVAIGKNSNRFDNKMLNGLRIFTSEPGMPEWVKKTDDLEQQMRKYLRLPSQSLDYISSQFGLGGKIKMDFNDWILIDRWVTCLTLRKQGMDDKALDIYCNYMYRTNLVTVLKEGLLTYNKMCKYGIKDTKDTRTLWNRLSRHFEPRFDPSLPCCTNCNGFRRKKSGFGYTAKGRHQRYTCLDCGFRLTEARYI